MALPGASLTTVKRVLSHTQALGQCRTTLRRLGMTPVPEADTAGSARIVSEVGDLSHWPPSLRSWRPRNTASTS